jgi:hypothetical protein
VTVAAVIRESTGSRRRFAIAYLAAMAIFLSIA